MPIFNKKNTSKSSIKTAAAAATSTQPLPSKSSGPSVKTKTTTKTRNHKSANSHSTNNNNVSNSAITSSSIPALQLSSSSSVFCYLQQTPTAPSGLRAPSPRTEHISTTTSSAVGSSHPCSHNLAYSSSYQTQTTGNIFPSANTTGASRKTPARPPLPATTRTHQLLKTENATINKTTESREERTTTVQANVCLSAQQGRLLLWPTTLAATTNNNNKNECGCGINGGGIQQCGTVERQCPHNQQHHSVAIVQFIPSSEAAFSLQPLSSSSPHATSQEKQEEREQKRRNSQIGAELLESLKYSARMACCFCCCPIYRCVLWFCALELICSVYFWYCELSELIRNSSNSSIMMKDVLFLILLSGWLITLITSSVSVVIAQRKREAQWVLPRLVQQSGLLILGFLLAMFLVIYFAGGANSINNILISIYESLYSDQISRDARPGVHEDLRFYFLLLILFNFLFICYISSALCATKKLYREMHAESVGGGRHGFQPVNQYDPNGPPPQPPVNPHYKSAYA